LASAGAGLAIDTRSNVSFLYNSTGSPFEYANVLRGAPKTGTVEK
jgi:hypothetical protein